MKELHLDTLKRAFERLIEKLEFENVEKIEIEEDLYLKIPANKWDITNNVEDNVTIGSLVDDLENVENLVIDQHRICSYVDFDRVASILHAISQTRNPL